MKKSTFIDLAVLMAVRSKGKTSQLNKVEILNNESLQETRYSENKGVKRISRLALAVLANELRA